MKQKLSKRLFPLSALALTVASVNAASIIYEPFSQTAGTLNAKAGGIGLSGNWAINQTMTVVTTPTLNYGNVASTGGQVDLAAANNAGWASIGTTTALADAGLLTDGATLWFSYVFLKNTHGGSNEHSGFAFGTERVSPGASGLLMNLSGEGFGVHTNSGNLTASSWAAGARTGGTASTLQALGTPTLVIGKIVWNADPLLNDTFTVYTRALNDIATEPTTGGGVRSALLAQSAFDTISFGNRGTGAGIQSYDEIRFGATYADVVSAIPEPSSALLGGLGLLALLRRRR